MTPVQGAGRAGIRSERGAGERVNGLLQDHTCGTDAHGRNLPIANQLDQTTMSESSDMRKRWNVGVRVSWRTIGLVVAMTDSILLGCHGVRKSDPNGLPSNASVQKTGELIQVSDLDFSIRALERDGLVRFSDTRSGFLCIAALNDAKARLGCLRPSRQSPRDDLIGLPEATSFFLQETRELLQVAMIAACAASPPFGGPGVDIGEMEKQLLDKLRKLRLRLQEVNECVRNGEYVMIRPPADEQEMTARKARSKTP